MTRLDRLVAVRVGRAGVLEVREGALVRLLEHAEFRSALVRRTPAGRVPVRFSVGPDLSEHAPRLRDTSTPARALARQIVAMRTGAWA